jgi:hypothetical protein
MSGMKLVRVRGFLALIFLTDLGVGAMIFFCYLCSFAALTVYGRMYFPVGASLSDDIAMFFCLLLNNWQGKIFILGPTTIFALILGIFFLIRGRLSFGIFLTMKIWLWFVVVLVFPLFFDVMRNKDIIWAAEISRINPLPEWIFGIILAGLIFLSYSFVTRAAKKLLP